MKLYQHYKGKYYRMIGEALHSETLESLTVYETLYDNPKSKLWVRPATMFHEDVVIEGTRRPRFAPVQPELLHVTTMPALEPVMADMLQMARTFFSELEKEVVYRRLEGRAFLLQVARHEGKVLGFKLGYAESPATFYSWLGAVRPELQRLGIGSLLMQAQHEWCENNGFTKVKTKTLNKWRSMLILNLRHGFALTDIYTNSRGERKIVLEKEL